MKLLKYPNGTEESTDGLHLPGLPIEQDSEVLCGKSLSGLSPEEVEGEKPTCKNCISIAKELFLNRGYTKKAIKTW